jgi:hypothetical protein
LFAAGRTELVIAPPEGSIGVPSLELPVLSGAELRQRYPDLPTPIVVTGDVVFFDSVAGTQRPISGRVYFQSETLETTEAYSAPELLRYRTLLSTDSFGHFATVLPPGRYRTIVTPQSASHSRRERILEVTKSGSVILDVLPRVRVRGCIRTADGREAADARVSFGPSGGLRLRGEPEASWPRSSMLYADARGFFTADLDAGAYEVTVKLGADSAFPWVSTEANVCDQSAAFASCTREFSFVVPPPVPVSFQVVGPVQYAGQNPPVEQALLRAFALQTSGTDQRIAFFSEIGSARTDTDGRAILYLAPKLAESNFRCTF